MLSNREVKAFYDHIGRLQDSQGFYENPAIRELIAHADFGAARSVFEFGCGTGRVADLLLRNYLPDACQYHGVDLSETMVRLARERLALWGPRAEVILTNGSLRFPIADNSCDRFLSTYVFDLLSDEAIRDLLVEARRVLTPNGRLCLISLTCGITVFGRAVSGLWSAVQSHWPRLVGGCRPTELLQHLPSTEWAVEHRAVISQFAVASEVIVAGIGEP